MKILTPITTTLCLTLLLPLSLMAQSLRPLKATIDCGRTAYQQPVTATFELVNQSGKSLTISQVKASCGCTQVSIEKKRLKAGEHTTVSLTYDGRMLGHYVKEAAVSTNNDEEPFFLTMKGVVASKVEDYSGNYPYKVGSILTDREVLEFDEVNKGEVPQQIIHIMNNGTMEITPNI